MCPEPGRFARVGVGGAALKSAAKHRAKRRWMAEAEVAGGFPRSTAPALSKGEDRAEMSTGAGQIRPMVSWRQRNAAPGHTRKTAIPCTKTMVSRSHCMQNSIGKRQ